MNLNISFAKKVRIFINIKEIGRNSILRIINNNVLIGYSNIFRIFVMLILKKAIILTLNLIKNLLIVNI